MPRKTKTQETVVTEESTIQENIPTETGNPMEGDSPAEGRSLMDGEAPAGGNSPMDGEPSATDEAATDEGLPNPDETTTESDVPAPDSTIMEGDIPEETSLSEESTETEAETGSDGGMKLQPEDTGDTPVETDGDATASTGRPSPELPPETGTGDRSGTGENAPEAAAPPRRRRTRASAPAAKPEPPTPARKTAPPSILTLNADAEVETPENREDTIWHELQNAYRTRKILTGTLGGIEKMDGGGTIAVIYYKEMRIVIPLAEMMINLVEDEAHDYGEMVQRQNKILGNMLGCEIDFIIKGLENASRSVVASRKDAMYKKRQIFYMPDAAGNSRVCEDRIVQARVIAVAEKVVRVEIFGTECSILARDLSWDWLGDATERFHVGGQILVRILSVKVRSLEDISVKADVKSVSGNTSKDNLGKCKIQGKYAGTVTDIHKGTVFVRLHIGVNAVAHSCYDNRMPGKKDEVSFVVTRIDAERNVAVGLISRIIKQNI
ncbi:MAG: S1 RNA-binding domain-containing protein [bacterium]|nr:S1 RNA-binding domain-containing protein [bacterium]